MLMLRMLAVAQATMIPRAVSSLRLEHPSMDLAMSTNAEMSFFTFTVTKSIRRLRKRAAKHHNSLG